jgi:hypothetical protein
MTTLIIFIVIILVSFIYLLIAQYRRRKAYKYIELLRNNYDYLKTYPKQFYDWIEYIIRVLDVSDITDIEIKESTFGYRVKYCERTSDYRSNGFGHHEKFYKTTEKYLHRDDGTMFKDSEFFSSKESVKKAKERLLEKALNSILINTAKDK